MGRSNSDEVVPAEPAKSLDAPVRLGPKLLTPGEHGIGRFIPDLEFRLIDGQPSSLHGDSKSELTVVAMTSTSCPLSKKYFPTLVDIHRDFTAKGVRFILINCVATDKEEEMKLAAARFASGVEYTFDNDSRLANHLGATSTTDVFVLDRSHTVVYHGAIDDQDGFGYSIDTPRYTYLLDALDTYKDAVADAPMIREVVDRGIIPAWFAASDNSHSTSPRINDGSLYPSEKRQLFDWLDNKTPAGDPKQSPVPRSFADGWLIGKTDAVFEFARPVKVKVTRTMPYQNVVVDTHLAKDEWVQAIEVRPGNPSVVHHVLVFIQAADDAVVEKVVEDVRAFLTVAMSMPSE